MNVAQIKNIDSLVQFEPGTLIVNHEVKRLTAPGENYGSLMLSVDLLVKTPEKTETIHTVVKMIPPNELIQEIFNTQVTFRNEIAFYKTVIPVLQKFQEENNVTQVINFAAKCYGGRLNLTGDNEKVTGDAALVLENLKISSFVTLERTEGLDLEATRLVLKNLAYLHAVPLALKLKKPNVFAEKIFPYLATWKQPKKMHESAKKDLIKLFDQMPEIQKFKEQALASFHDNLLVHREPREPFATITHNDCWTNNSMFRLEGTKPVESKLVDFQIYSYGSPARDLIFFLFSSVKDDIVREKYGELLKDYHQVFESVLKELKCDTDPFSFQTLQKELDYEAKYSQFGHLMFMLFPIYMEHDQAKDFSELTLNTMAGEQASDKHKQKLIFILDQFAKNNWI